MPRRVTAKTTGEYIIVLVRLLRQMDVDTKLSKARVKRIKEHLSSAMAELQQEMTK